MVPLIISWGIWIARNECIFKDSHRSVLEIVSKVVGLIVFFSDIDALPHQCLCSAVQIDENIPWAFFDGADGGDPVCCGGDSSSFCCTELYSLLRWFWGRYE